VVTIVREDNKVVGETLIAAQAGSRQLLGAAALPSLYDDSYPRLGCSGRCGGDHSRNGDLDAGLPLVSGDQHRHWPRRLPEACISGTSCAPVRDDDVENKRPLGLS
jgi:hypothetical protein